MDLRKFDKVGSLWSPVLKRPCNLLGDPNRDVYTDLRHVCMYFCVFFLRLGKRTLLPEFLCPAGLQ